MYRILSFVTIIFCTISLFASDNKVFIKVVSPRQMEFYKEITLPAECINKNSKDYLAISDGVVDFVPEGTKKNFMKGEIILVMDKSITEAQKASAEAEFKQASLVLKRETSLFEKHIITSQRLEKARIEYHVAKAKLAEISKIYEHKNIHAPFDGEISAIKYKKGEYIKTGDFLFNITATSKKLLRFAVPKIYKIDEKEVTGEIINNERHYKLEQISISKSLSKDFSTYSSTAIVEDEDGLEHNSYVSIKLKYDKHKSIGIPEAAVIKSDGLNKVFILDGDKAKLIVVTLGDRVENSIEVTSGNLTCESQIVTEGIQKISDGQLVEVVG